MDISTETIWKCHASPSTILVSSNRHENSNHAGSLDLSPTDYGCILQCHCHTRRLETPSTKVRIPLLKKKLPGWFQ